MRSITYTWQRLAQGPRLACAHVPDSECAAVSIYIPAGSRDESDFPAGTAHFLEHMVFKGTSTRSARELSLVIENVGGQLNASTSEEQTVYEGCGEAEIMPLLIEVLADMVWNPIFPENEITLEREVIAEEITSYKESPSDHIGDLISAALWSPHPLGNPISGSNQSIQKIDREVLLAFQKQHHFRDDIVIAVSGPFSTEEILSALNPHLPSTWHAAPARVPFDQAATESVSEERDTDQLQLTLAWHTPGRHAPIRHALRLLSLMLGETSSSRLFLKLREERGLCYAVSSDLSLFDDTGCFEVSSGLDPDSESEAISCILEEIQDLIQHGPQPGELERAKRLSIAQSKLAFESTESHNSWIGESLCAFNDIPTISSCRASIQAVTEADMQHAAQLIFDQKPYAMAKILPRAES